MVLSAIFQFHSNVMQIRKSHKIVATMLDVSVHLQPIWALPQFNHLTVANLIVLGIPPYHCGHTFDVNRPSLPAKCYKYSIVSIYSLWRRGVLLIVVRLISCKNFVIAGTRHIVVFLLWNTVIYTCWGLIISGLQCGFLMITGHGDCCPGGRGDAVAKWKRWSADVIVYGYDEG